MRSRIGTEFGWVIAGQAAAAVGSLVGVRLLTQVLSPRSYGELALAMTLATLVQQTILLPIAGASLRFFGPAQEAGQLRAFWGAVRHLSVMAVLGIGVAGGVVLIALGSLGEARWIGLATAALLFAILFGFCTILDAMQNAARQRVVVAFHDGIGSWLRFLSAVVLVLLFRPSSAAAMSGYAAASALVLFSQVAFFHKRLQSLGRSESEPAPLLKHSWMRHLVNYAWPFSSWGVFTWAQMASDRWALQANATAVQVGLYLALYQLGYYPILLASGLLSQLAGPVLFARAGDGSDPERVRRASAWNHRIVILTLIGTALATAVAFLVHRQVFTLLVAPAYRSVSRFLPWMILAGGLFAAGQLAVLSLLAGTASKGLIAPKITTALLGVALNFAGAHWFGIAGVVAANVALSLFYCVWLAVQTRLFTASRSPGLIVPDAGV
jgi:O-antigen/teichoic acid export membrane protein